MMDLQEREKFYDAEVAPVLRELADKCRHHGVSLLAVVEWAPGEFGRTLSLNPPSGHGIRWADAAARANGNADALILGLMKEAGETGHSSLCLKLLGVPLEPVATGAKHHEG
jgi:hypothetical protein